MNGTIDERLRRTTPSLALLGMRGVGKTTLGRLAAEHLDADFIDADTVFEERHASSPKEFVAQHGWPAFRRAETEILQETLAKMHDRSRARPIVASLGGGVVEEETNRTLLKASWMDSTGNGNFDRSKRVAVIHVFRELDKVLLDKRGMPSWTGIANAEEVWQRRRPWFRESSSHEFVNFTEGSMYEFSAEVNASRAARLRFEAVERDFVRFLKRILTCCAPDAQPFIPSPTQRSYLVTFPFADLRPHVLKLPLIALGADAIELRADLLSDPLPQNVESGVKSLAEAYENPSLSYVSEQIGLIRRHLPDYPLVFTLRTPAQGGRYPYPADAPSEALFASLRHAMKLGCDVLDIEMGLNPRQTSVLIDEAKGRRITVLVSWRDQMSPLQGGFRWTSGQARQLFDKACAMGADIVKIVGTAAKVADNFALRVFAAEIEEEGEQDGKRLPPLSAYNMSYAGRISRFLNPTLASITHPLAKELSKRGVVGNPSMTFEEVQQALHLGGLLEQASFYYFGECTSLLRHARWYGLMGLPYSTVGLEQWPQQGLLQLRQQHDARKGDIRGICFPNGVQVDSIAETLIIDEGVRETGVCDCIVPEDASDTRWQAFNKVAEALTELISSSISPSVRISQQSSCLILTTNTGDQSSNAHQVSAVQAARRIGLGSVLVHHSDDQPPSEEVKPMIIINCRPYGSALVEDALSNREGGVYLDLYDCQRAQSLLERAQFKQAGWRRIDHATVWRHVDALRFRAFTGRRAPSSLADEA